MVKSWSDSFHGKSNWDVNIFIQFIFWECYIYSIYILGVLYLGLGSCYPCRSIAVMLGHLQNLVCQEFKLIGRRLTIDLDLLMDMVILQKYTLPFTSMIPICYLLQHAIRTNRYLSTREIVGNSVSSLDSRTSLCLKPCKIILTWN